MSPDDTLTPTELQAITGATRPAVQAAKLARLGVPYRWTGRAAVVERAAALLHELLPAAQAAGMPRLDNIKR